MKIFYLIVFCIVQHYNSSAQYTPRESAIGIRAGGAAGITYKKFFNSNFAFEIIAANDFPKDNDGIFISGLFEKHAPLAGRRFSALIGGGPSYHFDRNSFGVSAIIGFDWRILNSPLNLQVDWSPGYYFAGEKGFTTINAAFSVRYILNLKKVYSYDDY